MGVWVCMCGGWLDSTGDSERDGDDEGKVTQDRKEEAEQRRGR